jgi:cytochrome P450
MSTPTATGLHTFAFWERPQAERDAVFTELRRETAIRHYPPAESLLLPPDENTEGFWSVFRHADIVKASRDPATFCSGEGIFMEDFPEVVRQASLSFIVTDAPRHTQLRGIVQRAFSARNVEKLYADATKVAKELVGELAPRGECDFSRDFARQLPGRLFANFFGVPPGDLRDEAMHCAEMMAAWSDPEELGDKEPIELFGDAAMRLNEIALELTEQRRAKPGDDLLTWVIEAELDGERLDDWEIGSFFSLLAAAANDTSRHSMAHAMLAFQRHPDQRALLLEDLHGRIDSTVDEVLRWATPLLHMRRTATRDTEIAGQEIKAGEKVVLWYCSGNRDETVFDDPFRFDILRSPNKHLSFGGGGPHYCLGSNLAKQTLRAALLELYTRMPDIEVGEPEFLVANFVHGIKRLPATWTPTS